MIKFQAHKGVSAENPENTMPAFIAAIEQGFDVIELDISVTKDSEFVALHDRTINRTARNTDGSLIENEVNIADITYADALNYDFGIGFSKKFRGTKIPLFKDVLELAEKRGIQLKIDNKYQFFSERQRKSLFKVLKPYEDVASLTCNSIDALEEAIKVLPGMNFHYDGTVTEECLQKLSKLIAKDKLTVWLPYQNKHTSWVCVPFVDVELATMVKKYSKLGIWLLSKYSELEDAERLEAEIIETNGQLKPQKNCRMIADMHTHSENSHDSVCTIEQMCLSQIEKGTKIMAVTDHCDVASYKSYDVFTPIKRSYDTLKELNKIYADKCEIMSGVEISEGFWYPKQLQKIENLCDYDVILGSVHLVKYKNLTNAYSQIDFSLLTIKEIYAYLDAYFDDIITMLETTDFDILTHLTCPLRYITGKYKINVNLEIFEEKIKLILQKTIDHGKALEINTSSFSILGESMPGEEILNQYYNMGGYLITLGSDAHIRKNASINFKEAKEILKKIGFKNLYYYKTRKPIAYEI